MSDEEVEVQDPSEVDQERLDIEKTARELDWTPKEEWKGDPDQWKDAPEHVKHNEHVLPIVKQKLKEERASNDGLRSEMDALRATVTGLSNVQTDLAERAYKNAIAEIEARQKIAVDDNDGAALLETNQELRDLEENKPEPVSVDVPAAEHPEFVAWKGRNAWFGQDPQLTQEANDLAHILSKSENLFGTALFDRVTASLTLAHPDKFTNPNRTAAAAVETAGSGPRRTDTGKETWSQLPAEAKEAGERFIKDGLYKTQEQYAEIYYKAGGR